MFHGVPIPDFDTIIISNGNQLVGHGVEGQILNVAKVGSQNDVVTRGFKIQHRYGSCLCGEHANLIAIVIDVAGSDWVVGVDFRLQVFEVSGPKADDTILGRREVEVIVRSSYEIAYHIIVNLDDFVNLSATKVDKIEEAVGCSHIDLLALFLARFILRVLKNCLVEELSTSSVV